MPDPLNWPLGGAQQLYTSHVNAYGRIAPKSGHEEYDSTARIWLEAPTSLPLSGIPSGHLSHLDFPGAHHAYIWPVFRGLTPEQTIGTLAAGSSTSITPSMAAQRLGTHYLDLRNADDESVGGSFYAVVRPDGVPDPTAPGNAAGSDFYGWRLGRLMRTCAMRVFLQTNSEYNPTLVAPTALGYAQKLVEFHLFEDEDRWGSGGAPLLVNLPYFGFATSTQRREAIATFMAGLPSGQRIALEPSNEPGGKDGFPGSNWDDEFLELCADIDATGYASRIDPIGPGTVNYTPHTETGFDLYLTTAVKARLAGSGTHLYNAEPDWRSIRAVADRYVAMRARNGIAGIPHWNTETGAEAEDYGPGMYGHQTARHAALTHFHVKMGGAPETLNLYELKDGGNTNHRGYLVSDQGIPTPTPAMMMATARHLRGTVPFRHQTDGPTPMEFAGLADELLSGWTARRADGTSASHVLPAVPIGAGLVTRYRVTRSGGSLPESIDVYAGIDDTLRVTVPVIDGLIEVPGAAGPDIFGEWLVPSGAEPDVVIAPVEEGCLARAS